MKTSNKPFAFKLAENRNDSNRKWKAREGVAVAGCSFVGEGNLREKPHMSPDIGAFC